jgi:large subunit ribosomal protein L6
MSRIGKKPIDIPAGVEVKVNGNEVSVKGPKGTLTQSFNARMSYELKDNKLEVKRPDDEIETKMIHGTTRAIIAGMVEGVTKGFSKSLIIDGVGYTCQMNGKNLVLHVGYANAITVEPLDGVTLTCPEGSTPTIVVSGIDKQKVGPDGCDDSRHQET